MALYRQSIAWWPFVPARLTPEELIEAALAIGYAGIELAPREAWPMICRAGLTIASHGGHVSLTDGLNRRENHLSIEKEIRANLKLAEEWNIPNLIVFSGNRGGLADGVGAEITADGLRRVARAAEDAGVNLVLELLNSKVDHPDYQCDHAAWGLAVCQMVGSPRVKLLYDIYHAQVMEGDLIRTLRAVAPWIGHVHTAGNPGRCEIDERQEINYPAVMRTLAETGYDGFVGQEFIPQGDALESLRHAFALCQV